MNEDLRNEIVRRRLSGMSVRNVARTLNISRGTVARVLAEREAARAGTLPTRARRPSLLDAYETAIKELLGRYPEITATRVWEELRRQGYEGSYTLVRNRLKELRPSSTRPPVVRFETAPGFQAQMDYSTYQIEFTEEGRRKVHLFSYILGYSRRQYLRFVERQDFHTTIQQHVRAFEHLGGVAATCLYDNMKVVVIGYHDDVPIYNLAFAKFATHYGFRPVACRPRRPQTKGKVERRFFHVETSLLNGRTFRSLAHLNEVTEQWLAETADVRIHAETKQSPLDRHALELPHLLPLPATHYETAEVDYRTVTVEGFVTWRKNLYSVPWRHLGQLLPVRITETELIVYSPRLDGEVARHELFPRSVTGESRVDPGHHPAPQETRERLSVLRERFAELGPVATQFLDRLIESQRYHCDQARRVLGLLANYSRADVLAAMTRAVKYGACHAAAMERILESEAQQLKLLDKLRARVRDMERRTPDTPAIGPRPLSEYQSLFPAPSASDEPNPHETDQANGPDDCPF
jgi:transposase